MSRTSYDGSEPYENCKNKLFSKGLKKWVRWMIMHASNARGCINLWGQLIKKALNIVHILTKTL